MKRFHLERFIGCKLHLKTSGDKDKNSSYEPASNGSEKNVQGLAANSGSWRRSDLVSQSLKPLDQLPFHFPRVPAANVIHTFLVIGLSRGHHVIKDDQDAVPDYHRGSFGPSSFA